MATVYRFWHSHDSLRLEHDGAAIVSGEGEDAVVQRFDSDEDAERHIARIVQHRRRSGYRIDTEEVAGDPGRWALADVGEAVAWDPTTRLLTVRFTSVVEARALTPGIVACAAANGPICLRLECDGGSPGAVFPAALAATPLPTVRRYTDHLTSPKARPARPHDDPAADATLSSPR